MPAGVPLLVRPGARFECHGDGLCCSDVHAIGPLSKAEAARVTRVDPLAVATHPRLGRPVIAPRPDHRCPFFEGDDGCRLHREYGPAFKPAACRRFPFGAVETPDGLRITTAFRCPCRSMGDRKPVDLAEAKAALATSKRASIRAGQVAPARIALTRQRRVDFRTYAARERALLAAIVPSLDASPDLPRLAARDWANVAHAHRALTDGTTSGDALAWFGDALLAELEELRIGNRFRPFAWAFDRAERRIVTSRPGRDVFDDYARDMVWSLAWADDSNLGELLARLDVAWRCVIRIARALRARTEERAFAEAVAMVEVAFYGPFGYAPIDEADAERAFERLERLENAGSVAGT